VYLSKQCITADIITAKASEVNICVPDGDEGNFVSVCCARVCVCVCVPSFVCSWLFFFCCCFFFYLS
jgi:hypothetical protein